MTGAVTGVPMGVAPFMMVKVTLPTFTVPAPLVTVALSVTGALAVLKVAVVLTAAVVETAGFKVSVCVASTLPRKVAVPE